MIRAALPEGLSSEVLARIEERAVARARSMMTARRFLDFEGPIGPGIESLQVGPVHDLPLRATRAKISARRAIPIPTLYSSFEIPRRELEGAMSPGMPLDASWRRRRSRSRRSTSSTTAPGSSASTESSITAACSASRSATGPPRAAPSAT